MSKAATTQEAYRVQEFNLKDLEFGHKAPQGGINDRVTGRDAEIDELAASIAADGLIQPLAVWAGKAPPYYVISGNRRLAALRKMHKAAAVMCIVIDAMDIHDALAKAVASNTYVQPHPVDQFEAFARLASSGMTAASIAHRYGIPSREVERALALGRLAPEIRKAWRAGKIAGENARAFTLEPDQDKQAALYQQLAKGHGLYPSAIRSAILGNTLRLARLLKFVGAKAYETAGGAMRVDLFNDSASAAVPANPDILDKLAAAKIAKVCDDLVKDGWKWAEPETALPPNARYQYTVIHGNSRNSRASKADKAKSGCIVDVGRDGSLDIGYGFVRPADAKAAATGKTAAGAPDKPKPAKTDPRALSNALAGRLDTQLAMAVQDVLKNTAGSELAEGACRMVAGMIDPDRLSWGSIKIDGVRSLMALAPPKDMRTALLKRFDAKDYFASIPTKLIVKLMKAEIPHSTENVDKMGKTQLVDVAVKCAAKAGWLPLQLRPAPKKKGK